MFDVFVCHAQHDEMLLHDKFLRKRTNTYSFFSIFKRKVCTEANYYLGLLPSETNRYLMLHSTYFYFSSFYFYVSA